MPPNTVNPAYANGRARRRPVILQTMLVALAAIAHCVAMLFAIDSGSGVEECALCGARSYANHFFLFGIGRKHGRHIAADPVSTLVQKVDGHSCSHHWLFAFGDMGGPLKRTWAAGNGISLHGSLRGFHNSESTRRFLMSRAADPTFATAVRDAVRAYPDPAATRFLDELQTKAFLYNDTAKRFGQRPPQ